MLLRRNVHLVLRMTLALDRTPRLEAEFTLKVDWRLHAIRNRNDGVGFSLFFRAQVEIMLLNPKMVAYAEMDLFPGGSAQSSKTGPLSIGSATP